MQLFLNLRLDVSDFEPSAYQVGGGGAVCVNLIWAYVCTCSAFKPYPVQDQGLNLQKY